MGLGWILFVWVVATDCREEPCVALQPPQATRFETKSGCENAELQYLRLREEIKNVRAKCQPEGAEE